jgi:hypothetical protein
LPTTLRVFFKLRLAFRFDGDNIHALHGRRGNGQCQVPGGDFADALKKFEAS